MYPNGVFASHLIGNVTSTAKGQLVGTMGIEGADNDLLKGTDGFKKVSQDNNGYQIPNSNQKAKKPLNGDNVYTTLDKVDCKRCWRPKYVLYRIKPILRR